MKRILPLLIGLFITQLAFASEHIGNFMFDLNSDGTAVVYVGTQPWEKVGNIVIPSEVISWTGKIYKVTSIGDQAFYGCK